jgi:SnoaL-like domain
MTLQELLDREAIRDCLYRYCRGIDRADPQALRSVYWPDATDRHGAYEGSASAFVVRALQRRAQGGPMVHTITNILIDWRDTVAGVESCFHALQCEALQGTQVRDTLLAGRYVDRFEARGTEWRVATRVVVYDWMQQSERDAADEPARFGPRQPIGAKWPADPLYAMLEALPARRP